MRPLISKKLIPICQKNERIDAYKGKKMCKVYENHTNTNLSQRLGLKLVLYVQRIVMI